MSHQSEPSCANQPSVGGTLSAVAPISLAPGVLQGAQGATLAPAFLIRALWEAADFVSW